MHAERDHDHAVRAARIAKGLSVRELAFFSGCAATTISRLERGEIEVSAALKARIAHALGVPVQKLWDVPA